MNSSKDLESRWLGMSKSQQEFVKAAHALLREIKDSPETFTRENVDPAQLIEDIEFSLHGVWKFVRNSAYHSHWLDIKGCTCPKMDNKDPFYYGGGKIIVSDCPWHWPAVANKVKKAEGEK